METPTGALSILYKCPLIGDQGWDVESSTKFSIFTIGRGAWTDIMLDHPYLEQRSREDAVGCWYIM